MATWPESYSRATRFLSAVVFVPPPAGGSTAEQPLEVVGQLPNELSAQTLRPFLDESFRGSPCGRDGSRRGVASLVLTDGSGDQIFFEAAELPGGSGCLAVCSPFPAFELSRRVLLTLIGVARAAARAAARAQQAAVASAAAGGSGGGGGGSGDDGGGGSGSDSGGAAESVAQLNVGAENEMTAAVALSCALSRLALGCVFGLPPPVPGLCLSAALHAPLHVLARKSRGLNQGLTQGPAVGPSLGFGDSSGASGAGGSWGVGRWPSFAWDCHELTPLDGG